MAYEYYKGRCIGRLLHFLYKYDMNHADTVLFGSEEDITCNGEPYADYVWCLDTDIPIFTFLGKFAYLNDIQAGHWKGGATC